MAFPAAVGGLFEYGADETIVANLEALRPLVPAASFMVGSVTKEGPVTDALRASNLPQTTHPRSLKEFASLANRAGWELDRAIDNLMTFDVRLRPS